MQFAAFGAARHNRFRYHPVSPGIRSLLRSAKFCSVIKVLDNGRLICSGPPAVADDQLSRVTRPNSVLMVRYRFWYPRQKIKLSFCSRCRCILFWHFLLLGTSYVHRITPQLCQFTAKNNLLGFLFFVTIVTCEGHVLLLRSNFLSHFEEFNFVVIWVLAASNLNGWRFDDGLLPFF